MESLMKPRIIFYGSTNFSEVCLKSLIVHGYPVVAVVTIPGRSKRSRSPIQVLAEEHNIPVLTPQNLKDPGFQKEIEKYRPEFQVVVAFKILPPGIYEICPTFNIHASLLPDYRGAAPIEWAIMHGEKETGVTAFLLDSKVDTGRIIAQKKCPILENDTAVDLSRVLSGKASILVIETLELLRHGCITKEQGESNKKAPKITREDREIDWNSPADIILRKIRALNRLAPVIKKIYGRETLILRAAGSDLVLEPGEIKADKKRGWVGTGTTAIELLEIQPAGKRIMNTAEFLNGYGKKR